MTIIIVLSLIFMSMPAQTWSLPESFTSQSTLKTNENTSDDQVEFERMCHLQTVHGYYLCPWQETPQRAQGCSVPFNGPQGHGQHPDEVHIIHLLEVDKLTKTQKVVYENAMPVVTVWLEAASWQSRMRSLWSSVPLKESRKFLKNESDIVTADDSATSSKKDFHPVSIIVDGTPANKRASLLDHQYGKDPIQSQMHPSGSKASRPLILLLTSDRPLTWRIKPGASWTQNLATKVQVIVDRESVVDPFLPLEIIQKMWVKKMNRKAIQRFARRTFHGVASFSQITGANTVRISVGSGGFIDHERGNQVLWGNRNKLNFCNFSSREDSYSVSATWSEDLTVDHCILGKGNGMKILIVEVQSLSMNERSWTDKSTFNLTESQSVPSPSQAIILLSELFSNEGENSFDKNVTVFFKSEINMQWLLSSTLKHTFVHFVTKEGDIIKCINNCGNNFKFTSLSMPNSRQDFVRKVLLEFGSYVEFLTIKHITGFELQVNQPSLKLMTSHLENASSPDIPITFSSLSTVKLNGEKRSLLDILESEMVITCEKSTLEIFLPALDLTHHGVAALHLKDEACQSILNGTHFILRTILGRCGSDFHNDGTSSVVSNRVFLKFNDPMMHGSKHKDSHDVRNENKHQEGIPIACGFKPLVDDNAGRSIFDIRDDLIAENDKNLENSVSESSNSIYQLNLYHKSIQDNKLAAVMYRKKVNLNDQIYVQVWMDDAPSAKAVPESCWINSLPPSSKNFSLLSGMCPVGKGVKLESQLFLTSTSKPNSFVFSFEISNDVMSIGHEIFVHCQIGICLANSKLSKDKSLLCMDPLEYCHHQNLQPSHSHSISTAHQLLSRGPIVVSTAELSLKLNTQLHTKCSNMAVFPRSSTISTDMTAMIALCSFIIGMGLTATLWFIHNKTEPKHRSCHRDLSHGSQSAGLGSSLSPHSACSSTNSQCAITS